MAACRSDESELPIQNRPLRKNDMVPIDRFWPKKDKAQTAGYELFRISKKTKRKLVPMLVFPLIL